MRKKAFVYLLHSVLPLLLLMLSTSGLTQTENEDEKIHKNSGYLELGGSGLWYSLNYDRVIKKYKRTAFTGRTGLSYFGNLDTNTMTMPLEFSFLLGKKKHFAEIGIGPTFLQAFTEHISAMAVLGVIGYRFQPMVKRGLMFRATFTPFIGEISSEKGYWNWVRIPWGGVSIGYIF